MSILCLKPKTKLEKKKLKTRNIYVKFTFDSSK